MEVPPPYRPHLYPKVKGRLSAAAGLLNTEPERYLPPQMEPVSDLDSGCVQPSSVGNPVSYPLELALLLCVSFCITYTCYPPPPHTPHTLTRITSLISV